MLQEFIGSVIEVCYWNPVHHHWSTPNSPNPCPFVSGVSRGRVDNARDFGFWAEKSAIRDLCLVLTNHLDQKTDLTARTFTLLISSSHRPIRTVKVR